MHEATKKQSARVALGVLAGTAVMMVVFAGLNRLDPTVIRGALLGIVVAIGNFLLLALSVEKAMGAGDRGKLIIKMVYNLRLVIILAAVAVGHFVPAFHLIAVVVPLVVASITTHILRAVETRREQKQHERE